MEGPPPKKTPPKKNTQKKAQIIVPRPRPDPLHATADDMGYDSEGVGGGGSWRGINVPRPRPDSLHTAVVGVVLFAAALRRLCQLGLGGRGLADRRVPEDVNWPDQFIGLYLVGSDFI